MQSLNGQVTTVRVNAGAGGVTGRIGHQVQHSAGHFVRVRYPLHRDVGHGLFLDGLIGGQRAGELGVGQARQQGIHPHILLAEFHGEGLGHGNHRRLGHRIDALEVAGIYAVYRRHIHNRTATVVLHQLGTPGTHEEVTTDVHVHGFVESTQVGVFYRAEVWVGCGVVDQDIQLAVRVGNVLPHRFNLIHFADVAGEGLGTTAVFTDAAGHGFTAVNLAAADNHVGTVMGQCAGDALADATAGTGDQGDFASQVEQVYVAHGFPSAYRNVTRAGSSASRWL